MADTTIALSPVGIGGTGNVGEMAFFSAATTITGASGITVISAANASQMQFGANPGSSAAINVDSTSYSSQGYSQRAGAQQVFTIGDDGTNAILLAQAAGGNLYLGGRGAVSRWFVGATGGGATTSTLGSLQPTAQIVGGSTNGLAIRNSANNRDNIQHPDAGGMLSTQPKFGIGYTVGAGGTVTQLTSKATAFTLDTVTGSITFSNSALVAFAASSATWTCSAMSSADVVCFNHVSGGTVGEYTFNVACSAGSGVVTIRNIGSGSLSEAPVVNYVIIKGAQS